MCHVLKAMHDEEIQGYAFVLSELFLARVKKARVHRHTETET